jgi:hypothetical protein
MARGIAGKILKECSAVRGRKRSTTVHAFDRGTLRVKRRRLNHHNLIIPPATGAEERYRLWRAHGRPLILSNNAGTPSAGGGVTRLGEAGGTARGNALPGLEPITRRAATPLRSGINVYGTAANISTITPKAWAMPPN